MILGLLKIIDSYPRKRGRTTVLQRNVLAFFVELQSWSASAEHDRSTALHC